MTKAELLNKMAVLLGGRVSEHLIFDHWSTGASDDLVKVTNIARSMVMQYGMDESLGHVVYEEKRNPFLLDSTGHEWIGEDTAEKIDTAVRGLVQSAYDIAYRVLSGHRDVLEKGAEKLLRQETLDTNDLELLHAEVS